MRYESDGQTRLAQAQQFARDVVEQSPQGDGFTLLRMSSRSSAIVAAPAYAKNDMLAEINAITARDDVADLASGLLLAKRTLASARTSHPRLTQHRLYIISDMGKNTWSVAEQSDVRETIAEIETEARVLVADVGVAQTGNSAIVSAKRGSTLPTLGAVLNWNVSVRSWNGQASAVDVEMRVDGRLAEKREVEIAANQVSTVGFAYRFDSAGQHVVSFHLPSDSLPADNHRSEVVTIHDSVRVLCVEGRSGSARNVALALSPADESIVEIQTIMDYRLSDTSVDSVDAIFLCNIGSITAEQATKLRDFLRQGGGVVMFLGDRSHVDNHNGIFEQNEVRESPILPAALIGRTPYGNYTFSPADYKHRLVESFRGQEESGLLSTPIWSYIRLQLHASNRASVVLRFRNGDPAIVEHSALGGKFALIATAPSKQSVLTNAGRTTPWNAWSVWPSFPPIIQELLAYSVGGKDDLSNVEVGQAIGCALPANDVSDFVTIVDPAQLEHRVTVQESLSSLGWNWSDTHTAGIYSAKLANSVAANQFAVNLADYEESQPDRVTLDSLPNQFQQNSIEVSANESSRTKLETAPLFRRLLGLLLILLLAESTVAWYFGNARA